MASTGPGTTPYGGHAGPVFSVAYAPDGTTLATGGDDDGTVRIWDTRTGAQRQLTGHNGRVLSVAYAPDGTTLATGGSDGTVRIWDTRTGEQRQQLTGHTGPVRSVAYAPDGTTLATSGDDRTVRIWDTRTGEQRQQLTGHTGRVLSVAYAPDGTTLATGGDDRTVRIWDTRTGEQRQLTGHTDWVRSVAYAPDGTTLASASDDRTVRIWDTRTGEQRRQLTGHTGPVQSVAYAPDGTTLATGGDDGTVRIWDTRTGEQRQQLTGHNGPVRSVAYAPDGTTLASASDDRTVRIWDTRTGEQRQLTGHNGRVQSVAYAPDGTTLASASDDHTLRIWNPRNGKQIDGTGFGVPRTLGQPLAGVRSDSPSTDDLIGVTSDVETLAGLIAATETAPPLAIALIGDWGAGKSSVMLQIQQHIDVLAEMSTNNPGLSAFAANVRQVRFNAWDYSDDQVWSGLVEHLFHVLAADPETPSAPPDPETVQTQRATLRRELAEQETAGQRLSDRLRAADRARQPQGFLSGLGSPGYSWRVVATAARELAHEIRRARWVLLGWAMLGAAAYLAWSIWGSLIGAAAAAVAAVIAPAAVIWQRLRAWHRAGKGVTVQLRRRLDERKRDINQQVADLKERLALIDASARLSTFLSDRATPRAYQEFRGLLGQVRNDLTRLSADLTAARTEWRISGAPMPPPLERIVLYIDDLDRCPPRRVVEVLEAVHLMLALDLFVVVVAVDARWLIQSLEYHYRQLFGTSDRPVPTASTGSRGLNADTGPLSPVDYLDKIFQIPYVLAPPPPRAMAAYLRSLLPRPVSTRPTQPPSGKASRSESTPIEASAGSYAEHTSDATGAEHIVRHDDELIGPASPPPDAHPREEDGDKSRTHKESQVAGRTEEPGNAIPDLRPLGLQLSQPEVEFMARLGPLLPTPRAAKKLANLYRLVRIGISDSGLVAFTGSEAGGPYQAVQILLALLVGAPSAARQIFQEIMSAPEDNDILTILAKAADTDLTEGHVCARISVELAEIAENTRLLTDITEYQQWCPRLARYSFHTRTMTTDPRPPNRHPQAGLAENGSR